MNEQKNAYMKKIVNNERIITALAIDQRSVIKKMINNHAKEATTEEIVECKSLVSKELIHLLLSYY